MSNFGKFSINGSQEFEERMTLFFSSLKEKLEKSINKDLYKAIILIGGYGRGEGGVLNHDGEEKPHNNFDFLVITNDITKKQRDDLYERFDKIVRFYCKKIDTNVEFSLISYRNLLRSGTLVITYDMKDGHKLIAGDSSFLKNMSSLSVENIPTWDIRNLMVNRGTLLLINDLILSKKDLTLADKKTVIKHCVKAIIGYGDALLYYLGDYDYSYVEKQKRMQKRDDVKESFKNLYDEAISFRFTPKYDEYLKKDLNDYLEKVKKELKEVHFECERLCFEKEDLTYKTYFNEALEQLVFKDLSLKALAKKMYFLLKPMPKIQELSFYQKMQYKSLGFQGILPLLFPYIAFEIMDNRFIDILKSFFKNRSEDMEQMKWDYLDYWKRYVNSNFSFEEYGLRKES